MKIDPKIQYKSETGNTPFFEKESEHLTGSFDGRAMEGLTGSEIRSMLDYDCKKNAKWGVYIMELPEEYQDSNDLKIYTPEYVQWLESKLEQLSF